MWNTGNTTHPFFCLMFLTCSNMIASGVICTLYILCAMVLSPGVAEQTVLSPKSKESKSSLQHGHSPYMKLTMVFFIIWLSFCVPTHAMLWSIVNQFFTFSVSLCCQSTTYILVWITTTHTHTSDKASTCVSSDSGRFLWSTYWGLCQDLSLWWGMFAWCRCSGYRCF